jgi:hypothetical protein
MTPVRLEEGQSHSFVHGGQGGYTRDGMPLKRWYVIDGGGRTFTLRERYRQRVDSVNFWPTRAYVPAEVSADLALGCRRRRDPGGAPGGARDEHSRHS